MSKCMDCQREIRWVKTINDKSMPIDPRPVEIGGNLHIVDGVAHVIKKGEPLPSAPLYVMHRATCPKHQRPDNTKIVNPLDAVKRIRQDIEQERRSGTKSTDETDTDAPQGHADREPADPQQGALPIEGSVRGRDTSVYGDGGPSAS